MVKVTHPLIDTEEYTSGCVIDYPQGGRVIIIYPKEVYGTR